MLDWHSCQICYPLEIKILLLYLWWSNGAVKCPLSRPQTYFDARERDYIVFQTGFDGWAIFLRLVCFFPGFIYLPPSVNNNIWSSYTKIYMRVIITKQWKVITVCTEQVRSLYIKHAASGLPNLTHLEGWGGGRERGTIWPGSRIAGGYHT